MYFFAKDDPFDATPVYSIPSLFFSDYNKICISIYKMTNETKDQVEHEIDSFEQKYAQIVDQKVYNETMASILESYLRRTFFLNNNN